MQSPADERQQLIDDLMVARQTIAREFLIGAISTLDASELTLIQIGTLMLLSDGRERTVTDAAVLLGRSLSATSRLLVQLVMR